MQGLTEQLSDFIANARHRPVPDALLDRVRNGFIDTVGVMLAGQDEPVVQVVRAFVAARPASSQEARVLMGATRTAARDAALINATAGHALDYDDVGLMGHPSVVLVPALLAEGERLHASGAALLRAYLVGYEVWAELIGRDQARHHDKGWHPTAVFGVMAVASAVAALRGLEAGPCRHALGIAASMASGLIANFGSMTKPFHAGQAAAHGIDAVNLAQAGMTAAPDALEHHAGYLAALSPSGQVDRGPMAVDAARPLRFAATGLTVKKYPMCFATHRVLDAMLDLVRDHGLRPDQVRAVRTTVGVTQATMLRNHLPRTGLEAKFSLEFAVAAALVARKVGLAELSDAFVLRPEVQALFPRVQIVTTDTLCPSEPTLALSDRVVIETTDGECFDSGEIFETRGGMAAPLTLEDLKIKFMDCTARLGTAGQTGLFERLVRFDALHDVNALRPD